MLYIINEIVLPVGYTKKQLLKAAAGRLRIRVADLALHCILRRSVDARSLRRGPSQIVNAVFQTSQELDTQKLKKATVFLEENHSPLDIPSGNGDCGRPVVVGAGPAGLLAALVLAKAGVRPLLLERGKPVQQRRHDVGRFWGKGMLDVQSNVLFGEGGAGTFSDGKLTSRSKDRQMKSFVLGEFIEAGAPAEIAYEAFAHLGSDRLAMIIPAMRQRIIELGGEVRFQAKVEGFVIENGTLHGVVVDGEHIDCCGCVLACGHSADDMYRLLSSCGVELSARDYAVGVRVELPQQVIDRAMLGEYADNSHLGAASFRLTSSGNCHTFCMCPGGRVISCSATPGMVSTNGMSLSTRSGDFGNAAFLVPQPQISDNVLSGIEALEDMEAKAYKAGGSDFSLPACTLGNFLNGQSEELPQQRSCMRSRAADFSEFLPQQVMAVLRESIPHMLRSMPYVDPRQAVLYGPETRSTSPVRVLRGADMQSVNTSGLFPAGEGAGYAGGIVSSAIDGAKAALALVANSRG